MRRFHFLVIILPLLILIGLPLVLQRQPSSPAASPTPSASTSPTISNENERIDAWIAANNLNQYGDAQGTLYTGGTPLFNEHTGQYTDRYDYIKGRHPDKPWN